MSPLRPQTCLLYIVLSYKWIIQFWVSNEGTKWIGIVGKEESLPLFASWFSWRYYALSNKGKQPDNYLYYVCLFSGALCNQLGIDRYLILQRRVVFSVNLVTGVSRGSPLSRITHLWDSRSRSSRLFVNINLHRFLKPSKYIHPIVREMRAHVWRKKLSIPKKEL